MKILSEKRCNIGEGPIWNDKEEKLYYTNGFGGNEICIYDWKTEKVSVRSLPFSVAAFAFDTKNNLIVSHSDGIHILNEDNSLSPIYDDTKYKIQFANDMKVGPDGAIYVGTQSGKRKGVSEKIDGKLYRISLNGEVTILLDGLLLSNGMDWSIDQKRFYHTDSDTHIIREYLFDRITGKIQFTGKQVHINGVDGFTIGKDDRLYVGCWGQTHIAVIDTKNMDIVEYIPTPCQIPTSCGFCGKNMELLAITTASSFADLENDKNAGFTALIKTTTHGRVPFKFGEVKK